MTPTRRLRSRLAAVGLLLASAGTATATERIFANPPDMTVVRNAPEARERSAPGLTPMAVEPAIRAAPAVPGEASLDLGIRMLKGTIYNPATRTDDPVELRAYLDASRPLTRTPGEPVYAGPTIRVLPGDTVRMTLRNQLPIDNCVAPEGTHNIPNCFNITNLHSHGLWVSPTGNSDNVLLNIQPGNVFQYEYNLPSDHPAGTFWYHPHRHGSTALQVGSGMAGALIVRGIRKPDAVRNGDIDVITEGMPEKIMVMEQVQYACRDANGAIEQAADGTWICKPGQVGGVTGYDQFGPGSWDTSGRYTTINGVVQPIITAAAGAIERWRLIHAGVRDTISFELRRAKVADLPPQGVASADAESWVAANCEATALATFEIAADGLTHAAALPKTIDVLQPGYRSDLLVAVPAAGGYCVIDNRLNNVNSNVGGPNKTNRLLAFLKAEGPGSAADPAAAIRSALTANAKAVLAPDVAARIVADLDVGLKLTAFVPHKSIPPGEVRGRQDVVFSIDLTAPTGPRFGINQRSYSPDRIDRLLPLGGTEEWHLTSTIVGHPFHIHVNPFQVVAVYKPLADGQRMDLTDPQIPYETRLKAENGDPQYLDLKGVWKDTIFTKQDYEVVVRTRYERYIGEYVLHCHILDHEDQGMMQNVRIVLPDTYGLSGRTAPGPHAH